MKPSIKRFSKNDDMTEVVSEVRTNGVAVIENLFAPDVMDSLAAKVKDGLEAQEPGGGSFFGGRKRSVTGLFARGLEFSEHLLLNECVLEVADGILLPDFPMSDKAARQPKIVADDADSWSAMFHLADPLTGPNCHHYRLNATVAMQVCQGGDNQTLHRDEWRYLPYMHRDPMGPELTVAFMVAVTDFTTDNGATRYVPGSNRWPQGRRPEEHEVVQATMAKGSVGVWLGSVYHGLGVNHTSVPRTGMIFSHGLDHLTQEENQFLAVPPEIAYTLPKRAQQLIGYRSSGALNYIEGLDDNHVLTVRKQGERATEV